MTQRHVLKSSEGTQYVIPEELPILACTGKVFYPSIVVPLSTTDPKACLTIDDAMVSDKMLGVFAEYSGDGSGPGPGNLYRTGTAVMIPRMVKQPDGTTHVVLQGLARIYLEEIVQDRPYLRGRITVREEINILTGEMEALKRNLLDLFQKMVQLAPNLTDEAITTASSISDPGVFADFVSAHTNLSCEEGQDILETLDVVERLRKLNGYIDRELELLELGKKIQLQIKGNLDKTQRDFYLREQLKAIQNELGEGEGQCSEIDEVRQQVEDAQLPEEAKKEADREIERLSRITPASAEYSVSRNYLDWLVNLPWNKSTEDNLDTPQVSKVLDEDHYGLLKVKERILEYLAVRKLKSDMKGPILCFVGPPGTGKTSVGHSIARAMGREFVRVSMGGIRDESEVRGHRRTYVGSMPGRIIQGVRRSGSNNPVFMLDEVDKISSDFMGDPAAALLEVLDPEQNHAFVDHYIDVPFDFSNVMFIATANILDPIHAALRDRMEIIELPGYTEYEKLHITKNFLVPRQLSENGVNSGVLRFGDDAILAIIRNYTREAGVRNLERKIGDICRKTARQVVDNSARPTKIGPDALYEYLGVEEIYHDIAEKSDEVGVVTGLAWTPNGGDILFVEAALVEGKGAVTLTGKLGEVMQESAKAALTYARSKAAELGISPNFYESKDVHIHVPAGAIPKDGPSAGVAMAVALISALTNCPVNKEVAITGEITLRGKALPVGGIKEKVLAAHRAGIKKIVMPKDNHKHLEEVPQEILQELEFVFIEHVDSALKVALKMPETSIPLVQAEALV